MILYVHSDAAYLVAPHARSIAGGHFFLGNWDMEKKNNNSAIHIVCTIMRNMIASVAEAKVRVAFINAGESLSLQSIWNELDHT